MGPSSASNQPGGSRADTCPHGTVPTGWYRVQQRDPNPNHQNSRVYGTLGLFCSVAYLPAEASAWQTTTTATDPVQ